MRPAPQYPSLNVTPDSALEILKERLEELIEFFPLDATLTAQEHTDPFVRHIGAEVYRLAAWNWYPLRA